MSGLRVAGQAVLPETRATGSPAQPEYLVDFWRVGQGLPHNTVNALLQSRNGYLWVGTAAGLARFDGLVFTVLGDETAQGLNQVCVTALLEDRSGALWVGTQRLGVLRLWRGKAEWFGVRKGLADEAVTSLAEDGTGTIWIGTQGGLNRWSDGRLSRFASSAIHAGDHIVALHAGGSGALWITTRFGVFRLQDGQATPFKSEHLPQGRNAEFIGVYEDYSGNLWAFGATFLLNVTQGRSLNNFPSFSLASSRVWTICEQHNGDFWIGTSGRGLFRFQNGRFEIVGAREGLEQCDVRALHADRTGNLWIGTSGNGLARLRPQILNVVGASHGLTAQRVTAIAADSPDGIWIGSADAGLWRWNGQRVEPFSGGFPLGGVTQIQTLCRGRDRSLWVGTWGAGLIQLAGGRQRALSTADGLADDIVLALTADPEADVIWAGTLSGDLHRITGTKIEQVAAVQELGVGPILCLLLRADKTLLIGTEQGGLLCWDGQQLSKVTLPGELFGKPIRCLYEDRKGGLWVGSLGGGALCQRGQTWIALGKPQGLASENIGVIAQDEAGHFWFGTTEHLYKARGGEVEGLLAGTRPSVTCLPVLAGLSTDGLKSVQGWPGVIRGAKGVQWIATSSDILPLGKVDKTSVEPPPAVLLEKVLVNGQPPSTPLAMGIGADANSGPEVLRLGPGMTSLDFEFTAIDFSAPEKIRFRHKLEGFDTEWVESDAARRAHYGPLPPGEYRFVVIAGKLDNAWNEVGASLNLVVTPPIWRAWWFLTISGILMVGLIWGVARFISARRFEARLRIAEQLHSMERERTRIAQDMHDEIGSKLTRISFLSEIARQTQASSVPVGQGQEPESTPRQVAPSPVEAIAHTSRELLQALDEIVWAVNPRNDSLEQLAGYLEQHAREYLQGTAFECEIHVPPQLPDVPLTSEVRHNVFLAFEEALNNILKHSQARSVSISMALEPCPSEAASALGHRNGAARWQTWFEVAVRDNGKGFDTLASRRQEQDGLSNMQARLQAVGGECLVSSEPGSGTSVRLRFPLTTQAYRPNLGNERTDKNK